MRQSKIGSVLVVGDLVRSIGLTSETSDKGFRLDGLYSVVSGSFGLAVRGPSGDVELYDLEGYMTDHNDDFAKHVCPLVLPRGI